jgi:transposase
MFIKTIHKKNRNGELLYTYYRLCESYRIGTLVRQRTVLSLGTLEELSSQEQFKQLADRIEALLAGAANTLFADTDPTVERLAQAFYTQLCEKRKTQHHPAHDRVDAPARDPRPTDDEPEHPETFVKLNTLSHESVSEIGAEWMCLQTLRQLKLPEFFAAQGWKQQHIDTTLMHIIAKAVYPASEHKTAQWIDDNSAIKELFASSPRTVSRHQLYKAGLRLYREKEALEPYLADQTIDLFAIKDTIILYDLTNTYFEGRKLSSAKARFGPSKEKRSDARLLSLALVCDRHGFIRYSQIYAGNISEPETLRETVDALARNVSPSNGTPLVVLDAGISTKENLQLLKERGYDYVCVTRSKLKDYVPAPNSAGVVEIFDQRGQKIEIRHVEVAGESDRFFHVHSHAKAEKEASMDARFSQHFEEELRNIERSLHKKGGTKRIEKVHERLGRIKERYPAANKHYKISVSTDKTYVTALTWERREVTRSATDGVYFLRTSKTDLSETGIWDIYNSLTQIEATFRILKTDLHLRPIHHRADSHSEAHIYLGIVAYMVVATIRHQLKRAGIHDDWQNIVRIMNTQKMVVSTVRDSDDQLLLIKKCSRPQPKALKIYHALNMKQIPFGTKKYVVPQ